MSLTIHRCCARLKILKQAWIFSVSHIITPPRSCIHRKAINRNKPSLSSGVLPSRQQYHIGTILARLLRRCTRLLMVLPSRQRSDMCSLVSYEDGVLVGLRKLSVASEEAHFVLPRAAILFCRFPVCQWADQTDGDGQTGKLAFMTEHTHKAARARTWGKQQTF